MRVRACALNHLDLWLRNGVPGHRFPLPLVPGSEIAGEVAALGDGVDDLEIGSDCLVAPGVSCGHCLRCATGDDHLCDRYALLGEHRDGGYAELVAVPRRNVLPLPRASPTSRPPRSRSSSSPPGTCWRSAPRCARTRTSCSTPPAPG
ncbi:MAG: alcohol dehydrogenase catalytic domain-containing protein [Thermoanaerobaculia bacterium]